MVDIVEESHTTYTGLPYRLEAGTPDISGILALGEAVDYLMRQDLEHMRSFESYLAGRTVKNLEEIAGVHVLGHPPVRTGAVSFTADGVHPYDIAQMADKLGYAVRSSSHCAQPVLRSFGVDKAVRVSPAFYNTEEEIDGFCEALQKILLILRR